MPEFKYRAFISYAHADEKWAKWIHRSLESYRVPKHIVAEHGLATNRLMPIFRDRDELASSRDLSATIREALAGSENLIVMCSRDAANSRWVNEEIRHFKQIGKAERVFCVLLGEPGESFPSAALRDVDGEGLATSEGTEPLAADARPEGDGRQGAKLKLIAGLLDVRLDELVRREAARRQKRMTAVVLGSVAGMVLTTALTIYALGQRELALEQERIASDARDAAVVERDRAEQARAEAEGVVDFLLDLFKVSDPSESLGNTITAREILDMGASRISRELKNQPEVQARLMSTMGQVYLSLGLYDSSADLFEQSLDVRRARFGDSHPEVAESLGGIASLQSIRGEYEAAETTARQVLAMRRELFGERHVEVAASLHALGAILEARGQYADSELAFRQSLEIRDELLGRVHEDTAATLSGLGNLMRLQDRYEEAEGMHREVLSIQRQVLTEPHPAIAETLNALGVDYLTDGDFAQAEAMYLAYLEMLETLLPEGHPSIAIALENLGGVYFRREEYERTIELLERVLAMRRAALGEDHTAVGRTLANMAVVYTNAGMTEEAEARYRETLPILYRTLGEEHPDIAIVLRNLALLAIRREAFGEAEELMQRSLEITLKHFGRKHRETTNSLVGLALTLKNQRRFDEAEPLLLEARRTLESLVNAEHPNWLLVNQRLAELYDAMGKPEKAATYRLE